MKIARTAQQWIDVQSLGNWMERYGNGDLWEYCGEIWYLSHTELQPGELQELISATTLQRL